MGSSINAVPSQLMVTRMNLRYQRFCIFVFCLLGTIAVLGQCSSPKEKKIDEFSANNVSRIAAVLKLGEQEHICFGIEYADARSLLDPISISSSNTDVQQILHKIFAGEAGYEFTEEDKSVLIARSLPSEVPNFFTRLVSRFVVPRATVQEISNALWMHVQVEANPEIRGFAGHFPTGDLRDVIEGFDEQNVSLRQLLFSIIVRSRGASWIATINPTHVKKLPTGCPWRILEYSQDSQDSGILSAIAESLEKNNASSQ